MRNFRKRYRKTLDGSGLPTETETTEFRCITQVNINTYLLINIYYLLLYIIYNIIYIIREREKFIMRINSLGDEPETLLYVPPLNVLGIQKSQIYNSV